MPERFDAAEGPREAPTFDAAVRSAVGELGETLQRFQELYESLPPGAFSDAEWEQIEATARDLEEMVSRGEDAYAAVAFDAHAWYTVMDQLQRVTRRLSDAVVVMEAVQVRQQPDP